jgi:preprotein translocase subunit SecG
MLTFFTILHILVCVFMVFVILLQPGKDDGMGSAIGGGGGGSATSAFGGRGAVTFLSKVTGVCAVIFFLTSLGLSFVGIRTSIAAGPDETPITTQSTAPVGPGAVAPGKAAQPASTPTTTTTPPPAPAAPAK